MIICSFLVSRQIQTRSGEDIENGKGACVTSAMLPITSACLLDVIHFLLLGAFIQELLEIDRVRGFV